MRRHRCLTGLVCDRSAGMNTTTDDNPVLTLPSVGGLRRRAKARRGTSPGSVSDSRVARTTLREARLDRIETGKHRLWQSQLRLTQVVHGLLFCSAALFMLWQRWTFWAAGVAAVYAAAGMWAFARWMTPREQQLRRHMVCLAKRRRCCVSCGYRLCDLQGARCPECGVAFDPNDVRHVLRAETLKMYSSLARSISAIVIVHVMFWVAATVQGCSWTVLVGLAASLVVAFNLLHWIWIRPSRQRNGAAGSPLSGPRCSGCGAKLCDLNEPAPTVCCRCARRLTHGDVFIRPDVRRHWDRRITSVQYRSLMLRWGFLVLVCGGLSALVNLNAGLLRTMSLGMGPFMLFATLGIPFLMWVVGWTLAFRAVARRFRRRIALLFAQINPTCRRCETDLSRVPVGSPCPACRAAQEIE